MSDHSKPRRWALAKPNRFSGYAHAQDGPIIGTDAIPVREDCITTEDVEAVAKWLARQRSGVHEENWDEMGQTFDAFKKQTRGEAADLLARIFEGGEQS